MAFTLVPDRAVGYAPVEADWDDSIKTNFNSGVWVILGSSTLDAPAASIDFNPISGSWAHLMLVCYLRSVRVATTSSLYVRLNNDSGLNYDSQYLIGSAATASAGESIALITAMRMGDMPANNAGANLFATMEAVIPHYANTANNKALVSTYGLKYGTSSGNLTSGLFANFWRSNAAITQITVYDPLANLAAGSRVSLIGMP